MNAEDLLPDVLIDVPNCPDPVAETEIVRAVGQFARDTYLWVATVVDDPVFDGGDTTIADPANTRILRIERVTVAGLPVEYDWDGSDLSVTEAGALLVTAALAPTNALVPPLFEPWTDAIVARAQGRLLMQSGKDWTSPQLAQERLHEYRDHVTDAKLRRAKGSTDQPLRVTAHP